MIIAALEEINMSTQTSPVEERGIFEKVDDSFVYTPDFDEMEGDKIDRTVELTGRVTFILPEPTQFPKVDEILADIEKGLPKLRAFPTVEDIERTLATKERAAQIQEINAKEGLVSRPSDKLPDHHATDAEVAEAALVAGLRLKKGQA